MISRNVAAFRKSKTLLTGAIAQIFDAPLTSYDLNKAPYHMFLSLIWHSCIIRNNHKKLKI